MKTIGKSKSFLHLFIIAGIMCVCFTGNALCGIIRDVPAELNPQQSNGLDITLTLLNAKKRNIVRPGKPISLQATFLNKGNTRLEVLYSRVYRAGNLVILDKKGERVVPQMNMLMKYHLLSDDWHLFQPGQGMQVDLQGTLQRDKNKSKNERKLTFDEIDFTLEHPGEYTIYFVLRQDEPSRSGFTMQDEWTGCAVSNPVKIDVR